MTEEDKFILPDYGNCLVNLANSVLKRFGADTTHDTLPLADKYLAKEYKNVVVLLLDAMGMSVIEKHLDREGFFRSHLAGTLSSVFPPTTVAATTSVMSGLYPNEHGWLGWDMYFPELDKNVTVFMNTDQLTEKEGAVPSKDAEGNTVWTEESLNLPGPACDFNAAYKYTPYRSILDRIKDAGGRAEASMPFMPPYPATLDAIFDRIRDLCKEPGNKFIYSYWGEPDTTMHKTGVKSQETHDMLALLEKKVEELASDLDDTLLLITADHGHIDGNNLCILDYPEVLSCLKRLPSIEPRALNLFVKEDCLEKFPEVFKAAFGDAFLLLTKEEALERKLFGPCEDREGLEDTIGDFLACAIKDTTVFATHIEAQMNLGVHAGMTLEEYSIPLIVAESI
ncbi:MAG: alkaline phosphatase family protein [Clostridiales bacterium]|nr:alkaline phosphatase family protein [Clostridiales bacterium]